MRRQDHQIYEGTNEIQSLVIARSMMRQLEERNEEFLRERVPGKRWVQPPWGETHSLGSSVRSE